MSELTNALQTIFSWLKQYYPQFEKSFKPGLTFDEIKKYDDKLNSYNFTSEFYELYQYRNGTLYEFEEEIIQIDGNLYHIYQGYPEPLEDGKMLGNQDIDPFLVLHYLPIEDIYFTKYEEVFNPHNGFAILEMFLHETEAGDELVCPNIHKQEVSPLMSSVTQYVHEDVYPSLTSKFLDLVDSIESNAYFFANNQHGRILCMDTSKICRKRKIYRNYDVDINEDNFIDLGESTYNKRLIDL